MQSIVFLQYTTLHYLGNIIISFFNKMFYNNQQIFLLRNVRSFLGFSVFLIEIQIWIIEKGHGSFEVFVLFKLIHLYFYYSDFNNNNNNNEVLWSLVVLKSLKGFEWFIRPESIIETFLIQKFH